jgi:hypothetical protein
LQAATTLIAARDSMKGAVDVDECGAGRGTLLPRHGVGVPGRDVTLNRQRRSTWVVIPHDLIPTVLWVDLPPDISIAQADKCSHDTVAPTVGRTRHGGSLEAVICWRGTGSSNPCPSTRESAANLTPERKARELAWTSTHAVLGSDWHLGQCWLRLIAPLADGVSGSADAQRARTGLTLTPEYELQMVCAA